MSQALPQGTDLSLAEDQMPLRGYRRKVLHPLRHDHLQQRGECLGRGDMWRMAGVDFVRAPSRFALGALRKLAERVSGPDTFAVNVAARQRDVAAQPQRHFKALERLRQPPLRD